MLAEIDWTQRLVVPLITTVVIGVVGIVLLLAGIWLLERVTPYSMHKEIEEDHNVAAAIVIGSIVVGLAIIIAAVAKG